MSNRIPETLFPVSLIEYHILFSLVGAGLSLHGYKIMQKVETQMGSTIPTASLYRILRKMLQDGLIELDDRLRSPNEDPRKRYYRLTDYGQRIFASQTRSLKALANNAEDRLEEWREQAHLVGEGTKT